MYGILLEHCLFYIGTLDGHLYDSLNLSDGALGVEGRESFYGET